MSSYFNLTLEEARPENFPPGTRHSWPIRLSLVSLVEGLPSHVFVYHRPPTGQAAKGALYECVASLSQLEELPENESLDPEVPYFLRDTAEFVARSAVEAEEIVKKIRADLQDLAINWVAAQSLTPTQSFTIDV